MAALARELSPDEEQTLRFYRRAAGRLHALFVPHSAHQFRAHLFRAHMPDEVELIPETDFIALATAYRLIYAQDEPANFGRVANVIYRAGDEEARRLVSEARKGWREPFQRPVVLSLFGEHFDPESILDEWTNGYVFHQDQHRQRRVDLIRGEGALSLLVMQWTVRDSCFAALSLDNLCALLLDEPPRPLPQSPYPDSPTLGDATG